MAICAYRDAVSADIARSSSVHSLTCIPVLRDVRERGRDIEGCIKQWFSFVKPNFHKYVEPQRNVAGMSYPSPFCACIVMIKTSKHSSPESY